MPTPVSGTDSVAVGASGAFRPVRTIMQPPDGIASRGDASHHASASWASSEAFRARLVERA
jgi:hypothetical protein